jgi:UDP-glucose 4-epimerase
MRYLVTGGAGFIGSNIVDRLINDGHQVVVIDNESSTSNAVFYWNELADNYKLDVCNYEDIRSLFHGVDYVLHLAAQSRIQPSIENPSISIKTNTVGTATVLQCSLESGVKRLVYSSTSSAYGNNTVPHTEDQPSDCLTPYSVSKVFGENLCRVYYNLYGLETVVLRYFNVYGDRQPTRGRYAPVMGLFLEQQKYGNPLTIVGDGSQRRDFTNVNDVVEANILASTSSLGPDVLGTVFNIGTGTNYSIQEIANKISKHQTHLSDRPGESEETLADIQKARKLFGWTPKHSLESYI